MTAYLALSPVLAKLPLLTKVKHDEKIVVVQSSVEPSAEPWSNASESFGKQLIANIQVC